jgi:phosphatidylglycerophosphate synthase
VATLSTTALAPNRHGVGRAESLLAAERARAANYPLSRYWLRPLAGQCAALLSPTSVQPWQVSIFGALLAGIAVGLLISFPEYSWLAAILVLAAWLCDRIDGQLARRQQTATRLGAWLDGNLDELVDLGLHVALAAAAANAGSVWSWPCLVAFLVGKYLLVHGLLTEVTCKDHVAWDELPSPTMPGDHGQRGSAVRWLKAAYHLPANADVRVHLLALAIVTSCPTAELAFVAIYYNFRWIARYGLMIYKQGGAP